MNAESASLAISHPPTAGLPALANQFNDERKLNLAKFNVEERKQIDDLVARTPVLDSAAVTSFGMECQERMNRYLDELMQGIRTSDVGVAGALTLELARSIKAMNLSQMKREAEGSDFIARTFGRLPVMGKYLSALRCFQLRHQQITKHLSSIEDKARREMATLAAMNLKLDKLAERTLTNLNELELNLAAGQAVLVRSRSEFTRKRTDLESNPDPIALTALRDDAEQINAFEARLLRMHIAFADALTSLPQIRVNQEAGRIEIRNIMDTVLFDLPRLKGAILRVASLSRIMQASKTNQARRDLTRQIGSIGAEALDTAYVKAKESQGSGAEDVAALAATADKLLETIAKGVSLDEANRQRREDAHRRLGDIKNKLLTGLGETARQLINRGV